MEKIKAIYSKRNILYAMLFAAPFSLSMIFGAQLEKQENVRFTSAWAERAEEAADTAPGVLDFCSGNAAIPCESC